MSTALRATPRVGAWNADIAGSRISGPFEPGAEIVMPPAGDDPVHLLVAEATVNELFVDEARFDRLPLTGAGADDHGPQIGPVVTADWPETMAALVKLAQDQWPSSPARAPASCFGPPGWQRDIATALAPLDLTHVHEASAPTSRPWPDRPPPTSRCPRRFCVRWKPKV
ncbi:hypothetical protein ABZ619_24330 [Streptomyces sp. NPDC007851]|uniref:hypothetical protein n=1 Tax=Streptomyces sp. NPDC007851 TaxID=3155008 RepID=UPI00340E9D16